MGDPGLYFQAEGPEVLSDQLGGLKLAVAQLGVLVDLVSQLDRSIRKLLHSGVHCRSLSGHAHREYEGCKEPGQSVHACPPSPSSLPRPVEFPVAVWVDLI
jgi:hypothetical protein